MMKYSPTKSLPMTACNRLLPITMLVCLIIVMGFPTAAWSAKKSIGQEYRQLFEILESGDSISEVLDRSRWPQNDLLASYLELELLLHPRYRMTTERIAAFLKKWPKHPFAKKMHRFMEWRITNKGGDQEALSWYDKHRPKTKKANLRYLKLLLSKKRPKNSLAQWKSLYREGTTFPKAIAKKTKSFHKKLTTLDREERARHSLHLKRAKFEKLLTKLPAARGAYLRTLHAAHHGQKRFNKLIKTLSPQAAARQELWDTRAKGLYNTKHHQAFINFILGKNSRKLSTKMRQILRFRMGRRLYHQGKYGAAITMLKTNVMESGGKLADSLWLAAWSAHQKGDRKQALQWFIQLAKEAPTSSHRAKGAYWASKLSRSSNQKQKWLVAAAKSPGSFYGLLAREQYHGVLSTLPKPKLTCPSTVDKKLSKALRSIKPLKVAGRSYYVGGEIKRLAKQHLLSHHEQLCLAQALGAPDLVVKMANKLNKQGITLWQGLYPIPPWKPMRGWKLDPALIWAATRQESLFFHRAESSAKALGLMQLIPSTAREESKKTKMLPSNRYWLQLPAYNLELGQSYLTRMLNRFDGDLLLAVSSYNAGPGRGDKWKKRRDKMDPITFIETIPFTETRNYVKRVVHGFAMYQLRLYGSASLVDLLKPGKQKIPLINK